MRFLCVPILALAPLAAQSVVSPNHFTNSEGPSYSADGFGTTLTPNRYLSIHADLAGAPISISRISFRRDAGSVSQTTLTAYNILCDVLMSTAATTPAAPSATFDNNHGANKQTLLTFGLVNFGQTVAGHMPRPFEYAIPLPNAYAHSG